MRKGLGLGKGKGYYNLMPMDSHIHSLSAMGVKSVSIPKYMGDWYAQGVYPAQFTKNCKGQKARYNLKENGKVGVLNTCIKEGKDTTISGTARSVSEDNKNLKVSFFPFIEGDYKIEYLSKDYNYVIVGHPDKTYLWVMSRDKTISKKKYQELLKIAEKKGYNLDKVEKSIVLNAKGMKTGETSNFQNPTVQILSEEQFNKKFDDDYKDYEIGYATTRIYPDGKTKVYVKDSGDYTRNMKLLAHEVNELAIFNELINEEGIDPKVADEMAHNLNEVKVEGVLDTYELDANN